MTRTLVILLVATLMLACERNEKENIYEPGGDYAQALDARGKRHVVRDGEGKIRAKIRVRDEHLKVYSDEMTVLGEVRTTDDDRVEVTRQAADPIEFTSTGKGVTELPNRLRIEAVEHGWAVFDGDTRRLGYFQWLDDGRLALRDDYSAAPRLHATLEDPHARSPAGKIELTIEPPYSAAAMLPFALDGKLDALDRVALGMWLVAQRNTANTTAPGPDTGAAD